MITQQVTAYLENCFTMPVLPATIFVLLLVGYGVLVILGALDFDLLDFDLEVDTEADINAFSSAGFVALKFLNIGEVPVMIWLCIYGLVWWTLSLFLWMLWDQSSQDPNTVLLLIRNVAVGVILTKFCTNPLKHVFAKPAAFRGEALIGQECEITTFEATTDFGQAKYGTEAAPLLLDVKMTDGVLSKGQRAVIVDYDPESKIHYLIAGSDPL